MVHYFYQPKYYHLRRTYHVVGIADEKGIHPLGMTLLSPDITVCLMPHHFEAGAVMWARGIAICNPKDQFCRRTGRAIAKKRAFDAAEMMQCQKPIHKETLSHVLKAQECNEVFRFFGEFSIVDNGLGLTRIETGIISGWSDSRPVNFSG